MTTEELKKYKKILILGYGKEGHSVERFLKMNVPTAEIYIADKKDDENYLLKQKDVDLVVRSPGVRVEQVFQKWTTAANIFFSNFPGTIVGITGTKGKSTTASLVAALLKQNKPDVRLIGNIGNPMLDGLIDATKETIAVIELSSYQLADLYFSPHITIIVNWYPEHLDFHGTFDAYKKAKQNSIYFQTEKDYFIFDPHETEVAGWEGLTKAKGIPYTEEYPFEQSKIPLLGNHNKRNIQGALTVARLFGVTDEQAQAAIYSFIPLPHRLQNIGTYNGITFYDDAISTTPESTMAALNSIEHIDTILLGGQDRGYDFKRLVEVLKEKKIENIVLFPQTGFQIKQLLLKMEDYYPTYLETDNMKDAVSFCFENSKKGSVCLLSTASPSYSLWKNFEEKGDLFQTFVRDYGGASTSVKKE